MRRTLDERGTWSSNYTRPHPAEALAEADWIPSRGSITCYRCRKYAPIAGAVPKADPSAMQKIGADRERRTEYRHGDVDDEPAFYRIARWNLGRL